MSNYLRKHAGIVTTNKETVQFPLVANIVLQPRRWFKHTTSTGGYQLRFRIQLATLLLWREKLPSGRRSQGWRVLTLGFVTTGGILCSNSSGTTQSSIVSISGGQRLLFVAARHGVSRFGHLPWL